eukprot:jgi/Botrbrau1/3750/Bobra.0363s0027.1
MSNIRKLQQDIDKTLKKVYEGIELFDRTWTKVHESEGNQKEKYEGELKKEIKKLQRYRDTIKTWTGLNEIKDKTALVKARKDIEAEMERFKICEKETKTKAFSKEGLGQAAKLDPREAARRETESWITSTKERLMTEVEEWEADLEGLQSAQTKKSRSKVDKEKLAKLDENLSRHRRHIERLEQMYRLLDNEALEASDLSSTRDLVDDYLENGQELFDEFSNPDDAYMDILQHLEALEVSIPVPAVTHIGKGKDSTKDKDKERERQVEKERLAALAAKQQLAAHGGLNLKLEDESALSPDKGPVRRAEATTRPVQRAAPVQSSALPRVETAQSDAASLANSASTPSTPGQLQPQGPAFPLPAGPPQLATPVVPVVPLQLSDDQRMGSQGSQSSLSSILRGAPSSNSLEGFPQMRPAGVAPDLTKRMDPGLPRAGPAVTTATKPASHFTPGVGPSVALPPAPPPFRDDRRTSLTASLQGAPAGEGEGLPTLAEILAAPDLTAALINQEPAIPLNVSRGDLNYYNSMLMAAQARQVNMSQPSDRIWEPPKRNPNKLLFPPSYPTTRPAILEASDGMARLEAETLFYAFYYQPGTAQQRMAAKELKNLSWRYHKGHQAWFQRKEEEGAVQGSSWDKGDYIYFDYKFGQDITNGWCYRLKSNFTFRYDLFENEF